MPGDIDLTDLSNNLIKHDPSDNPRRAVCKDNKHNIQTHPAPHGPRELAFSRTL